MAPPQHPKYTDIDIMACATQHLFRMYCVHYTIMYTAITSILVFFLIRNILLTGVIELIHGIDILFIIGL